MRTRLEASTPALALTFLLCLFLIPPCRADDNMAPGFTFAPPLLKEFQDVELNGDLAVIFAVGGLVLYDLAEQDLVGVYIPDETTVRTYRGAIGADFVYAGAREDLLQVIDISNPSEPQLATGEYFAVLQTVQGVVRQKMVLVR